MCFTCALGKITKLIIIMIIVNLFGFLKRNCRLSYIKKPNLLLNTFLSRGGVLTTLIGEEGEGGIFSLSTSISFFFLDLLL